MSSESDNDELDLEIPFKIRGRRGYLKHSWDRQHLLDDRLPRELVGVVRDGRWVIANEEEFAHLRRLAEDAEVRSVEWIGREEARVWVPSPRREAAWACRAAEGVIGKVDTMNDNRKTCKR